MSDTSLEKAKELLELVIGPDDLISKVEEFGFKTGEELLKAQGMNELPSLPSPKELEAAKEQKKALIFRVGKTSEGKEVQLAYLKEKFGTLIYSDWFLKKPEPFVSEPIKAGWALVDLEFYSETAHKTYEEQQEYAKANNLQLKSPASDAYDLIVAYRVSGKFYRASPWNARTSAESEGEPVKISHFNKSGMAISTGWGHTVRDAELGAATELILT